MNPVEEFLMEKQALSPAVNAAITMGAISAGTTALAAVGTAQLQAGIQSAHDAVSRSVAFKKMMRDAPSLKKMEGKRARRYFNTLYNTAPELAKDPFAAASWVQKVDDYDYVDPQSLNTLANTGAKMRERKTDHLLPAFQLAQGATQAGMGEYARQQDQLAMEARDLQKRRGEMKRDIVKSLIGAGGSYMKERTRQRERIGDQDIRLGQEMREGAQREWDIRHSPQARGVGGRSGGMTRQEYGRKYEAGKIPSYPRLVPQPRPPQPSGLDRMKGALKGIFGR